MVWLVDSAAISVFTHVFRCSLYRTLFLRVTCIICLVWVSLLLMLLLMSLLLLYKSMSMLYFCLSDRSFCC